MINWQSVCLNLRRNYKPLSSIAKELGCDWQHLNRIARGETREPKFTLGVRLLDLHYDKCRDRHESIREIY